MYGSLRMRPHWMQIGLIKVILNGSWTRSLGRKPTYISAVTRFVADKPHLLSLHMNLLNPLRTYSMTGIAPGFGKHINVSTHLNCCLNGNLYSLTPVAHIPQRRAFCYEDIVFLLKFTTRLMGCSGEITVYKTRRANVWHDLFLGSKAVHPGWTWETFWSFDEPILKVQAELEGI